MLIYMKNVQVFTEKSYYNYKYNVVQKLILGVEIKMSR